MGNHKKYWKSEVELSSDNKMISDLKNNEFAEQLPSDFFLIIRTAYKILILIEEIF